MTKQLLLIRHAEASESSYGQKDFERTLTSKGIIDAANLGMYMLKKSLIPDAIFSSAATRAKSTAITVAEKLNYQIDTIKFNKQLYEASTRTLLELITQLDDHWSMVYLIGHNPTISYFAEYLTKDFHASMRPAGMLGIKITVDSWKEVSGGIGELQINFQP